MCILGSSSSKIIKPQGKKLKVKEKKKRRGGRRGKGKRPAGTRARLCVLRGPSAHPPRTGSLCHARTPQQPLGPVADEGKQGGLGLLLPKPGKGITWGWPGGEQQQSPHPGSVSGAACPRGSSFGHLPVPFTLSKLSWHAMLKAPLGSTKPDLSEPRLHPTRYAAARPGRSGRFGVQAARHSQEP